MRHSSLPRLPVGRKDQMQFPFMISIVLWLSSQTMSIKKKIRTDQGIELLRAFLFNLI